MARTNEQFEAPIVRVGLLGAGTVGAALLEMIDTDSLNIAIRTGVKLEVAGVAVRDLAARENSSGSHRFTTTAHDVVIDQNIDIVVELMGGIEPARTLMLEAFSCGKHVVTANKELLAESGPELFEAAQSAGRQLLFEGAVGGAIPLIRALHVSLAGDKVLRVTGIVNGTTNYILSRMSEERIDYAEALLEAQSLGFAERDPTADVAGFDARAKAAILSRIAFDVQKVSGDVYREGIESIEIADIEFAERLGYVIKLLVVADLVDQDVADNNVTLDVRVHPAMVPKDHPLAGVRGSFNAIFVEADAAGELMLYGRGAGGRPSASAVLGDVIAVAHDLDAISHVHNVSMRTATIRPIDELLTQYYLAVDVEDRPGVLAAVATVFGEHSVSIRSMEQVGLGGQARLVFITHLAKEKDVQKTVSELAHLSAVRRVGTLLRVIGPEQAQ